MPKKAKGPICLCADIADMCVPIQIVSNCYAKIFDIFSSPESKAHKVSL